MKFAASLSLIAILASALAGCWQEPNCPPSLSSVRVPGAESVDCRPFDGTYQIAYVLAASYPAEETIKTISSNLHSRGWLPLAEDFLNPGLPSSHVDGWSSFHDSTVDHVATVHQWMADWTDLDDVSGQIWSTAEKKTFDISNSDPYSYYRIYVTISPNANYAILGEVEMIEYVPLSA